MVTVEDLTLQSRLGSVGGLSQHESLILLRCELAARAAIQEKDADHDDDNEQRGDRRIAQAAFQAALVAAANPLEACVDELDDA